VFRAYDPRRDRHVAVKLFTVDLSADRVRQLIAEFEQLITADLTHPGIAAPVATGMAGSSVYLAHDFVQAETFDVAIRQYGPAPPDEARRVLTQLAGAIDFAAAVKIVHGALHPRDVLLRTGDTVVTGLGVACALQTVGVRVPSRRPYTAPELLRGEAWDRRADVFTLAALAHELFWGRRLTATGDVASTLTDIAGGDRAALAAAVSRGLADRADDRFSTALEFAEAIDLAFAARSGREGQGQAPLLESAAQQTKVSPAARFPADAAVRQDTGSSSKPGERRLDVDLRAAEPARYREAEIAPAAVPWPLPDEDLTHSGGTRAVDAKRHISVTKIAEPVSQRPSRSMWPLAAMLVVGIGLGFAVGYGFKTPVEPGRQNQNPATAQQPVDTARPPVESAAPPPAPPASGGAAALGTPGGREFTESVVPERPRAARPPANSDTRSSSEPAAPAAVEGRLLVRSEPAGATVIVNGREYGPTPAVVRGLERGTHTVRIIRDGYVPEERSVAVTRAQPAPSLLVTLQTRRQAAERITQVPTQPPIGETYTGSLVIESRPAGATVYLDNRSVGRTPLTLNRINAGAHVVRLEREGYQNWSRSVRVVATEHNRVTASLER
jgi:hypothetical protein